MFCIADYNNNNNNNNNEVGHWRTTGTPVPITTYLGGGPERKCGSSPRVHWGEGRGLV